MLRLFYPHECIATVADGGYRSGVLTDPDSFDEFLGPSKCVRELVGRGGTLEDGGALASGEPPAACQMRPRPVTSHRMAQLA